MNGVCGILLKEWAAIVAALRAGRQAILLRKGGLVERGDTFALEHARFWLFPTFVHQQEQGVTQAGELFLEQARLAQPAAPKVRLSLLAEAVAVWTLKDEETVRSLCDLHVWTPETIASRFHYRVPGLTLVLVRAYLAAQEHLLTETPEQAGCRSWVPLAEPLDPGSTTPVLDDETFAGLNEQLRARLAVREGVTELSLPRSNPN